MFDDFKQLKTGQPGCSTFDTLHGISGNMIRDGVLFPLFSLRVHLLELTVPTSQRTVVVIFTYLVSNKISFFYNCDSVSYKYICRC